MATEVEVQDWLAHYGVKGMKWGVIRDKQRTIREAEAMKNGTVYKEGLRESVKALGVYANRNLHESGDFQRQYVLGKAYLEGKGVAFKKDPSLAHVKDIDGIMEKVVKPINPDFGQPGTVMNCRRATMAYEMRRRGNDVKATLTTNASGQTYIGMRNATTPGRDDPTRGNKMYKEFRKDFAKDPTGSFLWGEKVIKDPAFDAKAFKKNLKENMRNQDGSKINWFQRNAAAFDEQARSRSENVLKELEKQGNGARGELGMAWVMGGGHSVAYEVVGGKAHVIDNQSGKKYSTPSELGQLLGYAGTVASTRLDNRPLNEDYLLRWIQDA